MIPVDPEDDASDWDVVDADLEFEDDQPVVVVTIGTTMPEDVVRPRTRAECREEARPCPWVGCKFHLYLDVNPETGTIKLNFPDIEPWDMVESCALDIAEQGGITLEEVGMVMNLTRERIRQVEVRGLLKLRMASPDPDEVGAALVRRPGDATSPTVRRKMRNKR